MFSNVIILTLFSTRTNLLLLAPPPPPPPPLPQVTLDMDKQKRARHIVYHARQESLEKKTGKGFLSVHCARQVSTRPTLPALGAVNALLGLVIPPKVLPHAMLFHLARTI